MAVQTTPGFDLTPAPKQQALETNYITDFNFLNQYLPDTYEKEFERYGNRTVSGFLRMVGAEMPSNSDLIKWAEQGRLHTKELLLLAFRIRLLTQEPFLTKQLLLQVLLL